MTIELKPGYWRRRDGAMALVIGPNPHAKDPTDGWVGASVGIGLPWSWDINGITEPGEELHSDLVAYLGPTLPPDPGEGWRLLRNGDDRPDDEWWDEERGMWSLQADWRYPDRSATCWYRRRETPEPPTPPEGWEVLPDGTEWQEGYKRYSTSSFAPHRWTDDRDKGESSGAHIGFHVWYARRVEPEPVWTPTDEYRGYAVIEGLDGNCVRLYCRVDEVERKYVRGDDFKWEDV